MSRWNHRVCETCWTGGIGVDEDGTIRQPTQIKDPEPQPCCKCGELVIVSGIYVRSDPNDLPCGGEHDDWSWSAVGTRPDERRR